MYIKWGCTTQAATPSTITNHFQQVFPLSAFLLRFIFGWRLCAFTNLHLLTNLLTWTIIHQKNTICRDSAIYNATVTVNYQMWWIKYCSFIHCTERYWPRCQSMLELFEKCRVEVIERTNAAKQQVHQRLRHDVIVTDCTTKPLKTKPAQQLYTQSTIPTTLQWHYHYYYYQFYSCTSFLSNKMNYV